jgi:hypothetical protein
MRDARSDAPRRSGGDQRAPPFSSTGGKHSIKVGDIDADGFDEILNGSIAIDNDGRTMWGTGLGHGDRFYLSDIDPDRPGLEVWYTIEDPHPQNGVSLWDARSGTLLFGAREPNRDNQIAGGLAGDIDPSFPGMEVWGDRFFFTSEGQVIPGPVPPQNELVWWVATSCASCTARLDLRGKVLRSDGRRAVHVVADLFGDWQGNRDVRHRRAANLFDRHAGDRMSRHPDGGPSTATTHPTLHGLPMCPCPATTWGPAVAGC